MVLHISEIYSQIVLVIEIGNKIDERAAMRTSSETLLCVEVAKLAKISRTRISEFRKRREITAVIFMAIVWTAM